jgi:hypothetical protein
MFLTTHAAAGALIGQQLNSPTIAFFVSIFAHFVMDFIPHGDQTLYQEWLPDKRRRAAVLGSIDLAVAAVLVVFLFENTDPARVKVFSAAIAGSLFPDLVSHVFPFIHERFREIIVFRPLRILRSKVFLLHPLLKQHNWLHKNFHSFVDQFFDYRVSPVAGFVIQIVIMAVLLVTIL